MTKLLDSVNGPADLKNLTPDELDQVADEVRELIVTTITACGGHYASNLGAVELAVALHHVFDSPWDKIVWDVGHQAYPHKILTGRREKLDTIRQLGGISGFLSREESIHDAFGAGHASTSISAALGMAVARDLSGGNNHVVAVIGDGALTGGMAFEGLNNLGHLGTRMIVILNDNEMSIAPNVGALSKYLNRIRTDPRYTNVKARAERSLQGVPGGPNLLAVGRRMKNSVKEWVIPTMIWEELGMVYVGPIDGHNIADLVETLEAAKDTPRPVFIHVITKKGKGHDAAEADSVKWHAVAQPAKPGAPKVTTPKFQDVFGDTLTRMAREDKRVVAITAAMPDGTGLIKFGQEFPDRLFDVGIAEQHAVTFAAGLAAEGMRPCAAIYSTFLQRAYDQVIHDVCIQNLPVFFAMDRAGVVGDDGRTHQGVFDVAYLRCIPNIVCMAPKDENELQHMIYTGMRHNGPSAVRYARGNGFGVQMDPELVELPIGKAEILREGRDVAIVSYGISVYAALEAAEMLAKDGIEATVVNARFAKPLDEEMLTHLAATHSRILTTEESVEAGGFGSAVLEFYSTRPAPAPVVKIVGLPDHFVDHGPQAYWRDIHNLSPAGIVREVRSGFPELYPLHVVSEA
ncbi:MAG: 1-deoxy-D-xylulose-5-phosphate synthase [Chloroflexia bacterium]